MEIYIVGGAVRDKLLDREIRDIDRVVVGASVEEFLMKFPTAVRVGKSFPVFLVDGEEYSFARSDEEKGINSTGSILLGDRSVTLIDDLYRRDLTVNAMAINSEKELIDPFNGAEDVNDKILRHVSRYFCDDPLRVFRVARFAATLGFDVAPETINLMRSLKSTLPDISGERIFLEMQKSFTAESPRRFFDILREADVLEYWFKPVFDLIGVKQSTMWHPEGDAYEHTMLVLDKVNGAETRFAALCHDFGKGVTPKDLWPHHFGHDKAAEVIIAEWCSKLQQVPSAWIKKAMIVAKLHMKAKSMSRPKKIIQLALDARNAWGELQQVILEDAMIPESVDKAKNSILNIEKAFNVIETVGGADVTAKWPTVTGKKFAERLMELRINKLSELLKG